MVIFFVFLLLSSVHVFGMEVEDVVVASPRGVMLSAARQKGLARTERRTSQVIDVRPPTGNTLQVQASAVTSERPTLSPTTPTPSLLSRASSGKGSGESDVKVFDLADGDVDQVGEEFTRLDINSPRDLYKHKQAATNAKVIFTATMTLFEAIAHANIDEVKAFEITTIPTHDDRTILDVLVNNFVSNLTKFDGQQKQDLKAVFDAHSVLKKIGLCSFLWVAVEYAIQAKKNEENEKEAKTYLNRLEIIRVLTQATTDKSERYVLRARGIPAWWSFFCFPCFGPCFSASSNVKGGLLHRVAQEDVDDVLAILLDNGFKIEDEDEMGWTAYTYAVWFESRKVERYLLQRKAKMKKPSCSC